MPEVHQLDLPQIEKLGKVDIVIAIPTYNNAETIGPVVQAARAALTGPFAAYRGLLLNADGGSKDHTAERFLEAAGNGAGSLQLSYPLYPGHMVSPLPFEIPGRASAVHQILIAARAAESRACALIDPTAPSITPECIGLLLRPILEQSFDLVAPRYPRAKFQGTLISAILYPMTRALYGKRLWQPVGSDLGLSAGLVEHFLGQSAWQNDTVSSAVDLWMTTEALCNSFKICQAFLGCKSQQAKEPQPQVEEMVAHTAGAVFSQMARTVGCWQKVKTSQPLPCFGEPHEAPPDPATANPKRMVEAFQLGYRNLQEVWSQVLSPATLLELKKLAIGKDETFRFSDAMWVRAVYDFALGYRLRVMNRDHLLRALTPLYLGWLASFVAEMQDADAPQVEARIEKLCLVYEAQKPYLIARWRWPDRFNP